jgi:hypothetical protein
LLFVLQNFTSCSTDDASGAGGNTNGGVVANFDKEIEEDIRRAILKKHDTLITLSDSVSIEIKDELPVKELPIELSRILDLKWKDTNVIVTIVTRKRIDPNEYILFNRYIWNDIDTIYSTTLDSIHSVFPSSTTLADSILTRIKPYNIKFKKEDFVAHQPDIISNFYMAYIFEKEKGNEIMAIDYYCNAIEKLCPLCLEYADSIALDTTIQLVNKINTTELIYNAIYNCGRLYFILSNKLFKKDIKEERATTYSDSSQWFFNKAALIDTKQPKPYPNTYPHAYIAKLTYNKISWYDLNFLIQSLRKNELTEKGRRKLREELKLINNMKSAINDSYNRLDKIESTKSHESFNSKIYLDGLLMDPNERLTLDSININYACEKLNISCITFNVH